MIKRGLIFGLPIQVFAALIMVSNEPSSNPSEAVYLCWLVILFVSAPILSIAYVGLIRKVIDEKSWLVAWMQPAGRMSLTIYISQSLITSVIFGPWGLGLFQEMQTSQVLLLAIGIWLALVFLATHWLKKFQQGPLESLMGTLTRSR